MTRDTIRTLNATVSAADICLRFERQLAAIAVLDQTYYQLSDPQADDRASYYRRQERLEPMRSQFYSALNTSLGSQ